MKKYIVRTTNQALADMEEIYNYIALTLFSPENAMDQYERISEAILTLESLPDRIRIMESGIGHEMGLRPLIVDNYTVFYFIEGNEVWITDVLYSASDIDGRIKGIK